MEQQAAQACRQPAGDPECGDLDPGPSSASCNDEGGDPVCWLNRVCPECGRFSDAAPPTTCTRCGAHIGE